MAAPPVTDLAAVRTPLRLLPEPFHPRAVALERTSWPAVGQNWGFRGPQTTGRNLGFAVPSCVVLVSLVASLSLKLLLCKMDTITLFSQDFGWRKWPRLGPYR